MKKNNKVKIALVAAILLVFASMFTFIIYAETGDVLPDNGAVITSAQITSMVTGTGPFDTEEGDGNDTSADDAIVRSMDQVTYTIEATMAIKGTDSANYKGGEIYIEAVIPDSCTYEEWDVSSMAWEKL